MSRKDRATTGYWWNQLERDLGVEFVQSLKDRVVETECEHAPFRAVVTKEELDRITEWIPPHGRFVLTSESRPNIAFQNDVVFHVA